MNFFGDISFIRRCILIAHRRKGKKSEEMRSVPVEPLKEYALKMQMYMAAEEYI